MQGVFVARKKNVCLSVRLSAKRVHCNKTEERTVQIFIPYQRSFSLVLWEEWLVGQRPFYLKYCSTGPRWSEIADFEPILARSASSVTPSEKINTNRKPTSLRYTSYLAPKPRKGGSKTINDRFPCKIAVHLNKACCEVYLCKNCQQQSCKAFIGLKRLSMQKWLPPSAWKFGAYWLSKRQFSIYFRT